MLQDYEPVDSSDKENDWGDGNKGGGKDLIFHDDEAEEDPEKDDDGIVVSSFSSYMQEVFHIPTLF